MIWAANLFNNSYIFSQDCGQVLRNYAFEMNGTGNRNVTINWVIVKDDNCSFWISEEEANSFIEPVETFFNSHGITLNRVPCGNNPFMIDNICSTEVLNDQQPYFCVASGFCVQGALTVYLYPESAPGFAGNLGMAVSIPGTIALIRVHDTELTTKIIIHELGHCFGLIHTEGTRQASVLLDDGKSIWACDNQGGRDYARSSFAHLDCGGNSQNGYNAYFERVDGSNSNISGDFVTDTPADIRIGCLSNADCDNNDDCNDVELNKNRHKDPNCEKYRPDKRNFMRGLFHQCAESFTPQQVSRMKGILNLALMQSIQGEPCDVCPDEYSNFCSPCHADHEHLDETVISGNVSIHVPTLITKNLTINNGTLNIYNTLYVAPGVRIFVGNNGILNLNGGHITSCDGFWGGISIQANNAIVNVVGGGSISKANRILFTSSGGTITCNDAHFYENNRGILTYGNCEASFVSSEFHGMPRAVELNWNSHNITFENCIFAHQTDAGITSRGVPITVAGNNTFVFSQYGIAIENNFGWNVHNDIGTTEDFANQFIDCYNGIYAVNGNTAIYNNYFNDNNYGIVFRGINGFETERNSYSGSGYAELIDAAGSNPNQSFQNEYETHVGLFPHNNNNGYVFHNNCFNTLYWDVDAHGVINDAQFGPNETAAANCFSEGNTNDFMARTNNQVIYGIPDVPVAECYFPDNNNNYNYDTEEKFFSEDPVCGPLTWYGFNIYSHIIDKKCNIAWLRFFITAYSSEINTLKTSQDLTRTEVIRLRLLERQLQFAINQLAWCLRIQNRSSDLKDLYREFAKEDIPMRKEYAIKMTEVTANMGHYTLAKSEIDSIAGVFGFHSDIVSSLKLSIDVLQEDTYLYNLSASFPEGNPYINEEATTIVDQYISNMDSLPFTYTIPSGLSFTPDIGALKYRHPTYVLSQVDFDMLCKVAQMVEPEAAYGRALLSYLTGMRIQSPLNYNQNVVWNTKVSQKNQEETCTVYPNPTTDVINIRLNNIQVEGTYSYVIIDNFGRNVLQGGLNGDIAIDVSHLISGIYAVSVLKDGHQMDIKRFIKNQ